MPGTAVLVADVGELADLVEGVGHRRDLTGNDHHVHVGVGDLEAVLEVWARDVDLDLGADRNLEFAGHERPGLGDDPCLVFAVADLAQAGVRPRFGIEDSSRINLGVGAVRPETP